MGEQTIRSASGGEDDRRGIRNVLRDLDALERMLAEERFESDRRRIGAEQELVLVDRTLHPASVGPEVLGRVTDPRVVPELARFNLEFNCDPIDLAGDCLTTLERQLKEAFDVIASAASEFGATPVLTGICPTLELAHLTHDNITPRDRYYALDEMLRRMRGSDYELRIEGADELIVKHRNVMLEAVNTSFQVHYQVSPMEFASAYNTALAVAAPVLAASVNSPILFGKRLWRETRIALFQQVIDTRTAGVGQREMVGRVRFGERWVEQSVLEVLRADVARFRQILTVDDENIEDPFEALEAGRTPKLNAWQAFNGCVYRWMRPCYGVTDGKPHLRIENRVLPSGPTIEDEVANAALWIGLMSEGVHAWRDLPDRMELREARSNFLRAAQNGLACHVTWLDGAERPISELLAEELIPMARRGLERAGVADAERHLSLIEERVRTRQTGAQWMLDSIAKLRGQGTRAQRLDCLMRSIVEQQRSGRPGHTWAPAELDEDEGFRRSFATVSQCMTTDLFTVGEEECIDLIASIMDWERLRHIPVENERHELVGLVSYRALLRMLGQHDSQARRHTISAREVMVPDPVTVTPDTKSIEAIKLMREHHVSCLPVVEDGRLVGIVSERDYAQIARRLLERALGELDA